MKTILITGSGGLVGRELLFHLENDNKYEVYAMTSNTDKLKKIIDASNIYVIANDSDIPWDKIDVVVHCAFARSESATDLASALDFSRKIFVSSIKHNIKLVINVSSQSVYGKLPIPWVEDMQISPDSLYAMAKYSTEVSLQSLIESQNNIQTKAMSIRLASVMMNARFVNIFVNNAIKGNSIKIIGGKQMLSFIDVRDVADALISLISEEFASNYEVYNLGTNIQTSIIDIANTVKEVAKNYTSKPVDIKLEETDMKLDVCMDISKLYGLMQWKSKYSIYQMVESLFEYNLLEQNRTEQCLNHSCGLNNV